MDTEHSYYARVLDEVERLQPVGAGGGILVLNLMGAGSFSSASRS